MRTWIIGAAALLALAAVPGVASADATGYVGASYSNTDNGGPGGSDDSWGADGAVAFSGSSSISFEVDAAWADSNDSDSVGSIAGHVYGRNDTHLLGAFVGLSDSDATDTTWFVGGEGALYYDHVTLGASVAYANNDDHDVSGWGVQGDVRYFAMDNFRLDANVGWANIDFGGPGGDDNAWYAGVGGEYQFSAIPISIGLAYQHAEFDDADVDSDSWTVRLRYNWGGTLYDRDRHGASQADQVGFAGLL